MPRIHKKTRIVVVPNINRYLPGIGLDGNKEVHNWICTDLSYETLLYGNKSFSWGNWKAMFEVNTGLRIVGTDPGKEFFETYLIEPYITKEHVPEKLALFLLENCEIQVSNIEYTAKVAQKLAEQDLDLGNTAIFRQEVYLDPKTNDVLEKEHIYDEITDEYIRTDFYNPKKDWYFRKTEIKKEHKPIIGANNAIYDKCHSCVMKTGCSLLKRGTTCFEDPYEDFYEDEEEPNMGLDLNTLYSQQEPTEETPENNPKLDTELTKYINFDV